MASIPEKDRADFDGVIGAALNGRGLQAISRKMRLKLWAQSYLLRGVQPRLSVMTTPPIMTKGGVQASSVNSNYVNNSVQINGQDSRLLWRGGPYVNTTKFSIPTKKLENVTLSTGAKVSSGLTRISFVTDAEAVDFNFVESNGLDFNVLIDGQIAQRSKPFGFANSGNNRWVKVDFGANALTYALDNAPGVSAGGSGYAVNDIITLNGGGNGVGGTPAQIRVAQVSGGAVTIVSVEAAGSYSAQPTGTFGQASTTGSGTGATFTTSILAKRNTTRKMRQWEMIVRGNYDSFCGLVLPLGRTILNRPASPFLPRILFLGDSISAGTYPAYAGCGLSDTISQQLGLWPNMGLQAQGGTGWNVDNGTALRWSAAARIADIIAFEPDIVVPLGSQNGAAGTPLETSITGTLNAMLAGLPDSLFAGIGNIMGDSAAVAASIANGWAGASDQSRVRFINNHSPNKWIPSTYIGDWQATGDANHPHADGVDWFAAMASEAIGAALLDMALSL